MTFSKDKKHRYIEPNEEISVRQNTLLFINLDS